MFPLISAPGLHHASLRPLPMHRVSCRCGASSWKGRIQGSIHQWPPSRAVHQRLPAANHSCSPPRANLCNSHPLHIQPYPRLCSSGSHVVAPTFQPTGEREGGAGGDSFRPGRTSGSVRPRPPPGTLVHLPWLQTQAANHGNRNFALAPPLHCFPGGVEDGNRHYAMNGTANNPWPSNDCSNADRWRFDAAAQPLRRVSMAKTSFVRRRQTEIAARLQPADWLPTTGKMLSRGRTAGKYVPGASA